MWPAIRDLMDQLDDAIIVLDAEGEIAVINKAATEKLKLVGNLSEATGIRVLRAPAADALTLPIPELDKASASLPVVLAIRTRTRYLYLSPAFQRVFGSKPEDFGTPDSFLERVHPDDRESVQRNLEADAAGGPHEYECRIIHPSGDIRRIRVKVHPFIEHSSGQFLIASLTEDITDHPTHSQSAPRPRGLTPMADFRRLLSHTVDNWVSSSDAPLFAVAILDIARFRAVNDSFGYSQGDLLLEEVARRILSSLSTRNRVSSLGADRFGILFRSFSDPTQAEVLLRATLEQLSAPFSLGDNSIQISCRAGLAFPENIETSADELLRNADAALQLAKQRHDPLVIASDSSTHSSLEFDIAHGIDNDEFYFEFQPAFDPSTGEVKLLEALVRWRHPRLGIISPSSFISLAEDSGLVLRLDMQGLERLARHLDYWHKTQPLLAQVPISINISGRHFPHFAMEKQFHRILRLPALRQSRIILEITESVFVESNPHTVAGLKRLRESGAQIWLDDFGDGFSSLRYLVNFPVDGIKVSETLVKHCVKEEKCRVILSSLQTLARGLNVSMVVEGVESREQFETLHTMGFDSLQGYYLSKPLPAKDVPRLFDDYAPVPRSRKSSA